MPIAIAAIAIFIIGAEILLLRPLAVMSLVAIKYSKFNLALLWICVQKYSFRTILENLEGLIV